MIKRDVTLSWPAHPAMSEMVAAVEGDVNFHIVGARSRGARGGAESSGSAVRVAYAAAVRIRRYALGAVGYHRARSAALLRSAPKNRLVHSCSHLVYGGFRWIGDYENVNVLGFYSPRLLRSARFLEHLREKFSDESCRAIRVWSASAEQSFHALFADPEIRAKVRVIHPAIAIPPEARTARKKEGLPRVLFVARGFWIKGGSLFLDAICKLRHQFEFRVDFVCDLPAECHHYRTALHGIVDFYEPQFTREELYARFYSRAEIFVMLGMSDSYGVALLEASSFGLPIVAMRLNSGLSDLLDITGNSIQIEPAYQIFDPCGVHVIEPQELIRQIRGDTQSRVVESIAEVLGQLISDRSSSQQLGATGRAAVLGGPLSISYMRDSVLDMYRTMAD